jgi:hypothetical protein
MSTDIVKEMWKDYHYRIGWRLFCAQWSLEDCVNADQRAGYVAAWRNAEAR